MTLNTATRQGFRYLGNKNTKEVHDLYNEGNSCGINKIVMAGNAVRFVPDTLAQARMEGYDNCHYCIDGSKR
ncbi:MAG: hypothetical protein PHW02_02170 [bacterium]|nr:hypothetical protein [bacterium]